MKTKKLFFILILTYLFTSCQQITVNVVGVTLDNESITLFEGDSKKLSVTITPENATNRNVTWYSDNESVATVDKDGKITAMKAGTANITVITEDSGKSSKCVVTVLIKNDDSGESSLAPKSGSGTVQDVSYEYKLSENAVILSEELTKHISLIDENTISFSASSYKPALGQIIILPSTENVPFGLIGKISACTKADNIYTIEPVSLEEAFEDLDIIGSLDMADYMMGVESEDGNKYESTIVDPSVWGKIDTTMVDVKGSAFVARKTLKTYISIGGFAGDLYSTVELDIDLHIHRDSPTTCQTNVGLKFGFDGEFDINVSGGEHKCPLSHIVVPIPLGPVVIRPQLVTQFGFTLEGENNIKLGIESVLINERINLSNYTGEWIVNRQHLGGGNEYSLKLWESKGAFTVWDEMSLRFCVFNENVLSFGCGVRDNREYSGQVSFGIEDKLLEINPIVKYSRSIDIFAYAYARLIKNAHLGRYEGGLSAVIEEYELNLLTLFKNIKKSIDGNSIKVTGEADNDQIMKSADYGVALFKKGSDEPLEHISMDGNKTTTKSSVNGEIVFHHLSEPDDYEVKTYVVAQEGKYYYASLGLDGIWGAKKVYYYLGDKLVGSRNGAAWDALIFMSENIVRIDAASCDEDLLGDKIYILDKANNLFSIPSVPLFANGKFTDDGILFSFPENNMLLFTDGFLHYEEELTEDMSQYFVSMVDRTVVLYVPIEKWDDNEPTVFY